MDTVHRIRKRMKELGYIQKDLILYLEENQSTVSKWISTNEAIRNDIPNTILQKIAIFLETTTDYLLGNDDFPVVKKDSQIEIKKNEDYNITIKNDDIDLDLILVKTYDDVYASAGFGNELISDIAPKKQYFERSFLQNIYGVENFKDLEMIRVIGDSMLPLINDGEYILLEKKTKPKNGNIVIAIVNDELYVKKYVVTDPFNGYCRLESLNSDYTHIEVDTKEKVNLLNILGIVRSKTKVY